MGFLQVLTDSERAVEKNTERRDFDNEARVYAGASTKCDP